MTSDELVMELVELQKRFEFMPDVDLALKPGPIHQILTELVPIRTARSATGAGLNTWLGVPNDPLRIW
jgi:hypothetical protein